MDEAEKEEGQEWRAGVTEFSLSVCIYALVRKHIRTAPKFRFKLTKLYSSRED